MALQNGTELYRGSTLINYYETITVGADTTVQTKFTAVGTPGAEILYIYTLDQQTGDRIKTFTQVAASPEAGQFTYASDTKTITFNASETPVEGDVFVVAYEFMSADNAQRITVNGDGVPATCLATCYGLAKDTCTGDLFPCQVYGLAQIDG